MLSKEVLPPRQALRDARILTTTSDDPRLSLARTMVLVFVVLGTLVSLLPRLLGAAS